MCCSSRARQLLDGDALYSPATLGGRQDVLWVGGWPTEADIGPDRIYRLDRATGELALALARPGAHATAWPGRSSARP